MAVGASEPTVEDGGVRTGVVSDSGALAEVLGSGTMEPVQKLKTTEINIKLIIAIGL